MPSLHYASSPSLQDTYTRIMDMLGRQYDDEDLRAKMAATLRPFEIVASDNRGRAGVVSKEGPMTAEELLGHVLVYAKNLATGAGPPALQLMRPQCQRGVLAVIRATTGRPLSPPPQT